MRLRQVINRLLNAAEDLLSAKQFSNTKPLKRLLAGGTKLHGFSPAIMEACFSAAKELHDEISSTNASFKKVYESMNAYTNNAYQWFQVAELGYDSFMARHLRA